MWINRDEGIITIHHNKGTNIVLYLVTNRLQTVSATFGKTSTNYRLYLIYITQEYQEYNIMMLFISSGDYGIVNRIIPIHKIMEHQ